MTTIRHTMLRPSPMRASALATACVGLLCGTLLASDPLALIPADAAAVIGFPDLDSSAKRLNAFVWKHDEGFPGVDLDEVQRGFNLENGVLDTSAPVFLVFTRPSREKRAAVLVFTPRDMAAFSEKLSGRDNTVRRCDGPEGAYYLMMSDGVAFIGHKRKAVRLFRRAPRDESLAASLNDRQKALFASSDVVVHIPLIRWRNRIDPFVSLATNAIKLGVAMRQDQEVPQGAAAIVDWFVDGIRAMIDQMKTVTVGLDFDGETFHLVHHHTFAPGGSVADYLCQVERHGEESWTVLPDRPFFVLGKLDWQCPPRASLAERLRIQMFSIESVVRTTPAEERQRLIDTTIACWSQMHGSHFMATFPEGELHPVRFYGGYIMEDAEKGLEQLRFLQENANEAVSAIMGGPYLGKFERRACEDGKPFLEMRMDLDQMSPQIRQQTVALYGKNVRFQQGVVDAHHLVFAVAQAPGGVCELMEVPTTGRNVGKNPLVRRIISRLPRDPHAVVIADVGRCLAVRPILAEAGIVGTYADTGPETIETSYSAPPGPMLGWACVVEPNSLSGHFVIGADDALRVRRLWEGSPKRSAASGTPPSPAVNSRLPE